MIVSMNGKKERPTEAKENQTKPNQINEKKSWTEKTHARNTYTYFFYTTDHLLPMRAVAMKWATLAGFVTSRYLNHFFRLSSDKV